MIKKNFFLITLILLSLCGCSSISRVNEPEKTIDKEKVQYKEMVERKEIVEKKEIQEKVKRGVYLGKDRVGDLEKYLVLSKVTAHALKTDVEKVNPGFIDTTWEPYNGKPGKKVNIEKTIEAVMNAKEGDRVEYVIEEIPLDITLEEVKKNIIVIASYSTPIYDRSNARIKNIKIASKNIDYKKLSPGEEFSFNQVVGKRTQSKGYELAPIIINTEKGPEKGEGVGGGICQVSTTIYNAVEECGLEVTERHLHSKSIGYVPKGEDATVSYGSVDFKFKNNRKHSIMIRVILGKEQLTVKIYENKNI